MKITTLIENTKFDEKNKIKPEHGVSLFIETGSHKILFDTGASEQFSINAGNPVNWYTWNDEALNAAYIFIS